MSRRQCKFSKNPWITRGMLTFLKNKNKLYAKYLTNKTSKLLSKHKKYTNKLTRVKEVAKRSYSEYLFQNAKNPTDMWKRINEVLRKTKPISTIPQKKNCW